MVEAVAEDHVHPENGPTTGQLVAVHGHILQLLDLAEADAFQHFHGEHAGSAEVGEDARETHDAALGEVHRELLGVALLALEVQLAQQGTLEFGDHGHGLVALQLVRALGQFGQQEQDFQVGANATLDVRVLHLDHHIRAVMQPSAMHLTDGSRSHGLRIELGIDLRDGPPEFAADGGHGDL